MSLQDWGSLGEVLGAIATVITLVYLALQVRLNSKQMREATLVARTRAMDSTVEAFSRFRQTLVDPQNAELYVRGLASYRSLTEVDKVRFRAIIEEYFFAYAAAFERLKAETYKSSTWKIQISAACSVLENPGGSEWWTERKHIYGPEFVSEVEASIGNSAAH